MANFRFPRRFAALLLLPFFLSIGLLEASPVVNAVDFPFAFYPRQLWDRELVWMKNAGIRTVALEVRAPSEGQDVMQLLRTIHKLGLTAWVRLLPSAGQLSTALEPLRVAHGGPIAYLNNAVPQPVTRVSAMSLNALATSRISLASTGGTLLWTDVEDTLRPEFHPGAVSFLGDEQPSIGALRRDALLIDYWREGFEKLAIARDVNPSAAKLPEGVNARQLLGNNTAGPTGPSAVSIINRSKVPFRGDLRVYYPPAKRFISLVGIEAPAGESLWLPVNIPLAKGPFCKNCDALGNEDSVVYSTAELIGAEYENGILAMEFAAPTPSEVLLHLSKEPSGPLLAAGKPRTFDWDEATGRARLPVPAGKAPGYRVRIGLAMEPPEHSAFFENAKVLIIGQPNVVATTYTSEAIAARSRVRGPGQFQFQSEKKGPLQIDYTITVPPTELHGDHVELSLEADGVQMGHASLQLLRPASLSLREAVNRHFGASDELPFDPPLVSMDQRSGRNITIAVRNNFPEIKNYVLDLSGQGLEFSPAHAEISVGASSQRDISIRVFPKDGKPGLNTAVAKLTGVGAFQLPILFALIPRGETVSYSAGGLYIVENAKVRAVFNDERAQKWLEFTWKDSELNVLPDSGIDLGPAPRKVILKDAELIIEQDTPLQPEKLKPGKHAGVMLTVERTAPGKAVYSLSR